MSKEHKNPYRKGLYNQIFEHLRAKQIVTREDLMKFVMGLGKSETEAAAAVTVILSPREKSKRGDMRGNMSAQGHLYFVEKLGRSVNAGVKEPQKFRLRWRKVALKPRNRKDVVSVPQHKTKPAAKPVKAPAKVEAKAEAKTDAPAEVKA